MTQIDTATCAMLVRSITDGIAASNTRPGAEAPISEVIAHTRAISQAAQTKLRSALEKLGPAISWADEDGVPIKVSGKGDLGAARQDEALDMLRAMARAVYVVRPMAAASLQLAYLAAGRLDAYAETGRDAEDWLAGALLIREAGGTVTDLAGKPCGWAGDGIVASNMALHSPLRQVIEQSRKRDGIEAALLR